MKLHKNNDKPATPIHEIQKWGTENQVSDFINDVWPVNWTKDVFDHYVSTLVTKRKESIR